MKRDNHVYETITIFMLIFTLRLNESLQDLGYFLRFNAVFLSQLEFSIYLLNRI